MQFVLKLRQSTFLKSQDIATQIKNSIFFLIDESVGSGARLEDEQRLSFKLLLSDIYGIDMILQGRD